jgi:hypothetical protein
MTDNDEWGPWIEHDGSDKCPFQPGMFVQTVDIKAKYERCWTGFIFPEFLRLFGWNFVIRYRIRKPRGLTILEGLLENLPNEVDA